MGKAALYLIFAVNLHIAIAFAVPHTHKINKEVESHGAYSPRDDLHYKDREHHTEFDHEAILGSRNAAEEYDQLSPEEAKQRLKTLASKMDLNSDGYIDKRELIEWILRSFRLLTEEEALERLEDDDANEDGHVSWEEHLQETFGSSYDDESDSSNDLLEEKRMMLEDQELFKAADLNGDGLLNKKEYSGLTHPEEFEHMHKTLYEQTMKKKDTNKDQYLSLDEFLMDGTGRKPDSNSEYYVIEKERFETDFDLDRDGRLNMNEVLTWLIPNNAEMANTEADHLIDHSDDNEDGKLTIEEIVNHHDIFVGSEATDFGEHLRDTQKFNDEL